MTEAKYTVHSFKTAKNEGLRISMLTAYDYTTASLLDEAGVDVLLVGDSLGMVMLGYENTLRVTMDDMIHHTKAVARGRKKALLVGDMPFMSYHAGIEDTVRNAGRFIQEGMAEAVKLEGGKDVVNEIRAVVKAQIPVLGHLGLTPQSVNAFGGFKVQGKDMASAEKILEDALRLQDAGVFGIVLECVPDRLAALITERLEIPTIGIGAGNQCDGQVLVIQDLSGMYRNIRPKFVKTFAEGGDMMVGAAKAYIADVQSGAFPGPEHAFPIDDDVLAKLTAVIA